jgi:predicted enzyme related to lactoylglutathione lyase
MKKLALIFCFLSLAACGRESSDAVDKASEIPPAPDIIATNAFYYYQDVEAAWQFYKDVLGFETVVDYGFAKILRVAATSYITLVQADSGMHSVDEPKTVTLQLVTDELDAWFEHVQVAGASLHSSIEGRPRSNFVISDPEGYLLRFERYNPHANSESFVAEIAQLEPLRSSAGEFGVRAAIFTIYMSEFATTQAFYSGLFDRKPVVTPRRVALYHMAGSGFLALVDGGDELHRPTEENGVTISFFTHDVDTWYDRARQWPGFELRTPEVISESDLVRVFVGYDPEGIFLEWDTFLDLQENADLMKYLK